MKKIKKIAGITLLIMTLALPVLAWGPGFAQGFGPGPCWNCDNCCSQLTKEQQEKLNDLYKNYEDKTTEARNEITKKQIDLNTELNRNEPDIKKAKSIQKDINELQDKVSEAHLEFIVEAKKIYPDLNTRMGSIMGRGTKGMRRGM